MVTNNPITAHLSHHGPLGGFVQARPEGGEAVCYVSYATVLSDFVVMSFGVNPRATEKEATLGGRCIDAAIEREARKLGIKRLFIVHPNCDTAEVVRTYQLQPFTLG